MLCDYAPLKEDKKLSATWPGLVRATEQRYYRYRECRVLWTVCD